MDRWSTELGRVVHVSASTYDEAVVAALVLQGIGKCPDLGTGSFRAKVTWAALGDCPERREADRRLAALRHESEGQP